MKYFYIIGRKGDIQEVEFEQEVYTRTLQSWTTGGIILVKPKGHAVPIGLNSSDISNILTEDGYNNYIDSANLKSYIKYGSWYDSKHIKIRSEPWKQKEIDEQKPLPPRNWKEPYNEEERQLAIKRFKAWSKEKFGAKHKNP